MIAPSTLDQIEDLAAHLRSELGDANVEFTTFPSGSAMLDVRQHGRLFVMAFSPSHGFGVDEVCDGEGFTNGYEFLFTEFQPAANKLIDLCAQS